MSHGTELLERVDEGSIELLRRCGALARERGETAWLVGGMVRDLVRGVAAPDLDVVVEGDGLGVAQALSREAGGALTRYPWFQTARVDAADGTRVDVATARCETYPRPGDLPRVRAGTIRDDLERRDFTINTLAICLDAGRWGELLDPFDGCHDIAAGLIRVLHRRSFADDPTRILRAVRFSLRFGYALEPGTAEALREAMIGNYFETISGDRLRREILTLLAECPVDGPRALARHGALEAIEAGLSADPEPLRALGREIAGQGEEGPDEAIAEIPDHGSLALAVTAAGLTQQRRWALARRLRLTRAQRDVVVETGSAWARARAEWERRLRAGEASASAAEETFRVLSVGAGVVAAALASAAGDEPLADVLRHVLRRSRWVRPTLGGEDLRDLGCEPGPGLGEILERLRAARIDGEVTSVEEERELAARLLAASRDRERREGREPEEP